MKLKDLPTSVYFVVVDPNRESQLLFKTSNGYIFTYVKAAPFGIFLPLDVDIQPVFLGHPNMPCR